MSTGRKLSIILGISVLSLWLWLPADSYAFEKHVNCGGPEYVSKQKVIYEADCAYTPEKGMGYEGGDKAAVKDAISRTEDPILYQSERWGCGGYNFDLPHGLYTVRFYFCEFYHNQAGKRVFSVYIEGKKVISDLDIFKEAGKNTALIYEFPARVVDGQLNITAAAKADAPKFSAISLIPGKSDAVPPGIPSGIYAVSGDEEVILSWDDNEELDLQGYDVYRSETNNAGFLKITPYPVTVSKYIDKTVNNG
ncbi:MAG: malectin, partial [Candidatus Omnitrophota bacterium]|nr:malectin [Candidatus Omnitrophota bacterium]